LHARSNVSTDRLYCWQAILNELASTSMIEGQLRHSCDALLVNIYRPIVG